MIYGHERLTEADRDALTHACPWCGEAAYGDETYCSEACRDESARADAEAEMWRDDAAKDRARRADEAARAQREDVHMAFRRGE